MGRTKKIRVFMQNEHDWTIDMRGYSAHMPFNGYMLHMGSKHTLIFTRKCIGEGEKVHQIDVKVFINGRFSVEHRIEGELVDKRKKYFDTPMDGYVCLVTNEKDPMDCYGYWRPYQKGKLENDGNVQKV